MSATVRRALHRSFTGSFRLSAISRKIRMTCSLVNRLFIEFPSPLEEKRIHLPRGNNQRRT
ncbi:hypothetical protein [Burkholderia sp. 22088]|uniref:hypothetical protein n=1 Tax=Burkholderia sp. 22088 TaxID=3453871 RepID=UPI003F84C94A